MNKQTGQVLVLAIVVSGLVLFNILLIIGGSQLFFQNTSYTVESAQALNIAEGGINKALATLNKTAGSYNGESEVNLGVGSYSVTITNKGASTKLITSTSYIPNKTNPKVTRSISVAASNGVGTAFNYAMQIGEGGLKMDEGSEIRGSVYSNGNIKLDNDAKITGDVWVAGGTSPTADQGTECQGISCTDFIFGKNVSGQDRLDVAQSFKPTVTQVINKVTLKLKKFGNPSNVVIRILKDKNNRPDEDEVLTSGTLSAGLVTSTYNFVEVVFNQTVNLQANNTYWIVIDTSVNNSNYWSWSADQAQSYTRGVAKWSSKWNDNSPTWYTTNLDFDFQTFMGGTATYVEGESDHRRTVINGDVHANTLRNLTIQKGAYYQASDNITAANYYPSSVDPAPKSFPISEGNISDWKQQAQDAGIYTGNINNCPSSLPAGKYVGDVRFPSNCTVIIGQPIWITGRLDVQENVTIKLDPIFGLSSGVVMVDQDIELDKDDKLLGSGVAGSYLLVMSNFNSKSDQENRTAILVKRDGNSGVLYSGLGSVRLSKDNHITSITAWKINVRQNVIIEYDQGLAGTFFSFGPSGSYSLIKGTYQIK